MKKNISKIHYEVLDKKKLNLLNQLAPLVKNFVLSGGTALSLQIKHRQSFDFDFFSKTEIPADFLARLKKGIKISSVLVNKPEELTIYDENDIKISFICYPFFKPTDLIKLHNGIKLFSIKEIAAQKAYTIGRRGTYRDYFDIYAILCGQYLTLKKIIKVAEEIYDEIFNPKLFLEQLVYFNDLTNFEIIPVKGSDKTPNPEEVKSFLENEVKEVLKDWK